MPVAFLPLSAFAPGGSKYGGTLARADNVLPYGGAGYHPLYEQSFASYPNVVDGPMLGAYTHLFPSGGGTASYSGDAPTFYAGSKTKLYETSGGTFNDISRGGGYAVAAGAEPAGWRFVSFGNDIWAANGLDILQRRTNNAGNFANGPASTFVPRPRFVGVVREFLLGLDLSANGGVFSADQFAWSDINDATWWDDKTGTRPASLAGNKAVRSRPGQIIGFIGGEFGRIFKRNSIHALQLTGGSDVFRLDGISPGIGCKYPGSLAVGPDGAAYFWSGAHFYRQQGLEPPEQISPPEIEQLVVDGQHFPERACVHGILSKMYIEDLVMCGACLGRAGTYAWTWGNVLANNVADYYAMHRLGLFYNPDLNLWSGLNEATFNSTLLSSAPIYPGATFADFSLDNAVGYIWDGVSRSYQFRLEGPRAMAATFAVKRQPMALDGAERIPLNVKVKSILPLFTTPEAASFTLPVTPPAPANVTVAVTSSNEPHAIALTDADGAQVSPRVVSQDRTTFASEWGWHPVQAEGRWFDITISVPAGLGWRHFAGAYLDFESL